MTMNIVYRAINSSRCNLFFLSMLLPFLMNAQDNPCEVIRFYVPPFSVSKGTPKIESYMLEDLTNFYLDKVKQEAVKNVKIGIYSVEDDVIVQHHLQLQSVFCEEYGICGSLSAPKSANTLLIGLVHFFKESMKVQLELNIYSFTSRDIIGYGKSSKMELQQFFDEENRKKLAKEAYKNCLPRKHMKDILTKLPAPSDNCYIEPAWPLHLVPSLHPFIEGQKKEGYKLLAAEALSIGMTIFFADQYKKHRNKYLSAKFLSEQEMYKKKMNTDKWMSLGFGIGGYALVTLADILIKPPKSEEIVLSLQSAPGGFNVNLNFNF